MRRQSCCRELIYMYYIDVELIYGLWITDLHNTAWITHHRMAVYMSS